MTNMATPIQQADPVAVFDLRDDASRVAYFKQLGARNCDPPLPHSPCLRNKQTGAILPWEPILAEQTEILECCDEEGNTDPAAWQHKVIEEATLDPDTAQMLALQKMRQQEQVRTMVKNEMQNMGFKQQEAVITQPVPEEMPYGAVPYDEVEKLVRQLEA